MSETVGLILIFSFLVVVALWVIAVRLSTLRNEIHQTNSLIVELVAEKPKPLLPASGDPVVHDHHSDGEQFASVTRKASGAW